MMPFEEFKKRGEGQSPDQLLVLFYNCCLRREHDHRVEDAFVQLVVEELAKHIGRPQAAVEVGDMLSKAVRSL